MDGFQDPGSYSCNVTYQGTSLLQLASLTASSAHCEQFIMYECYHSRLFRDGYGWWVSRDGEEMKYWGGVDSIDYKCACGLNHICANPQYGCNCDKFDQQWRLRFGDTGHTSSDQGYHTLGKFKYFGLI